MNLVYVNQSFVCQLFFIRIERQQNKLLIKFTYYFGFNKTTEQQSIDIMSVKNQKKLHGIHSIIRFNEAIFGNQIRSDKTGTNLTYLVIHHFLRLIILVLCLIGCFAQILTIMNIFFNYPAIVFVDLHPMKRLLLPAITICNDNRLVFCLPDKSY